MLKRLLKSLAASVFSEWRVNWILASPPTTAGASARDELAGAPLAEADAAALDRSPTHKVRNSLSYTRKGLEGRVLLLGSQIVAVAHFAALGGYEFGSIWPLAAEQLALVDIVTEERFRGRGYAARLIREACDHYKKLGIDSLLAFIWWTNGPSLRAFRKAGWTRIGLSVEVRVRSLWLRVRIPLRRGRRETRPLASDPNLASLPAHD
ncbi:GNAT family N-acetyltransferase [Sphingosinicella sp. BN140058]|uniref:GNAT family N-acetyltransferase n=1 Tax=Sphingosinicella sp. BN140058 TaxID=1892855 RepID=UPI0010129E69|nr:GNAT family N-acetyltransferase [Sphingosinicella sp. BN140058]QAY77466.1 GNAT family N-acetyltransferase [Sphingosinicella sp. BN140058]